MDATEPVFSAAMALYRWAWPLSQKGEQLLDMLSAPSVTFVGAAHLDRLGRADARLLQGRSNPGRFLEMPGGAALNTASIFSVLGGQASLVSTIADDPAGQMVASACAERGLETEFLPTPATATYTALLEPDGAVALAMADMGAYDEPALPPITSGQGEALFVDANFTNIAGLAIEHDGPLFAAATSVAKVHRLRPLLSRLDILFCNRGEMAALLDLPATSEPQALASAMRKTGLAAAVITDAGNDVLVVTAESCDTVPVPPAKPVIDHTGAGDALAAATLFRYLAGADLARAVHFGCKVAARILAVAGPFTADLPHD